MLMLLACSVNAEPTLFTVDGGGAPRPSTTDPDGGNVDTPTKLAVWPASGDALTVLPHPNGVPRRPVRLYLDAGHGEPGNSGNQSAFCESEQDVMVALADDLAVRLGASAGLEVRRSRSGAARPTYGERITEAEAWPADLILSLHSDARAGTSGTTSASGCWQTSEAAGFSVLWGADESVPGIAATRQAFGRRIAETLARAGFLPYPGHDYAGLYGEDSATPGLFVDGHAPKKRIRMLRRPKVPSVILETHNALDPDEPLRWREERTKSAFAAAIEVAIRAFTAATPGTPEVDPMERTLPGSQN